MITKTAALKRKILEEIKSGRIPPGSSIPSRHQYMRKFSCARRTIDTVITSLMADGHLVSKRGEGTFVCESLEADCIECMIILDNTGGMMTETGLRSAKIAGECSFKTSVEIFNSSDCYARIESLAKKGNAVVWVRPDYNCYLCMNYLKDMGIPQLQIGRCYGEIDYVTTNAKAGIKHGLQELVRVADRISFISERNENDKPYIAERQIAFYQSCVELDLQLDAKLIFDFDESDFFAEVSRIGRMLLENADEKAPLGIFIANHTFAIPLLTYAEANGKRCGKDYFLLLFDVVDHLRNSPGIYMLEQRWATMTERIVDWLERKSTASHSRYAIKLDPLLLGKLNNERLVDV
jgi:DNA-binding LacI/PurR family transcriptional regulator/DNA-binding transcriptional regulator YhcF (GntR family)